MAFHHRAYWSLRCRDPIAVNFLSQGWMAKDCLWKTFCAIHLAFYFETGAWRPFSPARAFARNRRILPQVPSLNFVPVIAREQLPARGRLFAVVVTPRRTQQVQEKSDIA